MTSAAPLAPAPDLFARARAAAAQLRLGTSERMRLEAICAEAHTRGVASDDPRIARWLAAALCRSPAERAHFLNVLQGASAEPPPPGASRPAVVEDDPLPEPPPAAPILRRKRVAAGLLALLLLLLAAGFVAWWQSGADQPPPVPAAGTATIAVQQQAPAESTPPMALRPQPWAIAAMLLPLLMAGAFALIERHRRRSLRRDAAPDTRRVLHIALAEGGEALMAGGATRGTFRRLRRHGSIASRRLDAPATIAATIRAGGQPAIRFGTRPESPDYLLLSERESPRDHLAWVGRLLAARMAEEQVSHSLWEFLGDPRRLARIERGVPSPALPLATVLALNDRSRALLLMEAHDLAAAGTATDWMEQFAGAPFAALLDPRPRTLWGAPELQAQAAGLFPVAIGTEGLARYADRLLAGAEEPPARGGRGFDLPASLAADRAMLLDRAAPDPLIVDGLIDDLEEWLDPDGLAWLSALALFPYLHPGLTAHLGTALRDAAGAPLMEEARFLRLARLPWLRAGTMPDWLRRVLVRGLSPARLAQAIDAIQAFLLPPASGGGAARIDVAAGADRRRRARLREWLRLAPESPLSDRLLIDALSGRKPAQLGIEAPQSVRERLAPLWRQRIRCALLVALLASIASAVTWQPLRDEPVTNAASPAPQPDDALTDFTENDTLAQASDNATDAAENALPASIAADVGTAAAGASAETAGVTVAASAAAAAASASAAHPASNYTVWIQYPDGAQAIARQAQRALGARGYKVPGIELRDAQSPARAEVRYFTAADKLPAATLAGALAGAVTLPPPVIVFVRVASRRVSGPTLEVWLPRGSGSTGGGWGGKAGKAPTPPSTLVAPESVSVPFASSPDDALQSQSLPQQTRVPQSPIQQTPVQQSPVQQSPVQAAPGAATSPAAASASAPLYQIDVGFYDDTPEQDSLSLAARYYADARAKYARLPASAVRIVVTAFAAPAAARLDAAGYANAIRTALVGRDVPASGIVVQLPAPSTKVSLLQPIVFKAASAAPRRATARIEVQRQ